MLTDIDPRSLIPLHDVRSKVSLQRLVDDMAENGWMGRPLLVVESPKGFFAWTGSHRIAAAVEVGLESIPCYVVEERRLARFDADARWGHVDDSDRLKIVRGLGDDTAIGIMWAEGRDN